MSTIPTAVPVQELNEILPESGAVAPSFKNRESFELMQKISKLLSKSTLVPAAYRETIDKIDRFGNVTESRQNPNALANTVIALNIANRIGADELMVMQNLYIIEGRPSWSSQWIIAQINSCGRFTPLNFDITNLGEKTVERKETYWENRTPQTRLIKVNINDIQCIAWAIEKETGARIESPPVSIEMAVKEGWYTKNGSKWQTMPDLMLRYRSASFFGKFYAPELLMGLQTVEEAQDVIDVTPVHVPDETPKPLDIRNTPAEKVQKKPEETVKKTMPVHAHADPLPEKGTPKREQKPVGLREQAPSLDAENTGFNFEAE